MKSVGPAIIAALSLACVSGITLAQEALGDIYLLDYHAEPLPATISGALRDLMPPPDDTEPQRAVDIPNGNPIGIDDMFTRQTIRGFPGESVDLRSGGLTFSATDLVVPGNGGMDIVVSRSRRIGYDFNAASLSDADRIQHELMRFREDKVLGDQIGDWSLDIPHIRLVSSGAVLVERRSSGKTYEAHTPFSLGGVCQEPMPPDPQLPANISVRSAAAQFDADYQKYFGGVQLVGLPGQGPIELLTLPKQNLYTAGFELIPRTYISTDNWSASCAESAFGPVINGKRPLSKFIVKSPNGYRYEFDQPTIGNNIDSIGSQTPVLGYMRIFLTKVVDPNGNELKYYYDNEEFIPELRDVFIELRDWAYVDRIVSSDGREVRFEWECNRFSNGHPFTTSCPLPQGGSVRIGMPNYRLRSVTYGQKAATYKYHDTGPVQNIGRVLARVELPEGHNWEYGLASRAASVDLPAGARYTVTHPAGASATYDVYRRTIQRRTGTTNQWRNWAYVQTSIGRRVITDLDGPQDETRYCYSEYDSSSTTTQPADSQTYVLSSTQTAQASFFRERPTDHPDASREGLMTRERVYSPLPVSTPCSQVRSGIGRPLVVDTELAWYPGFAYAAGTIPFYPIASTFQRRSDFVRTTISGEGTFLSNLEYTCDMPQSDPDYAACQDARQLGLPARKIETTATGEARTTRYRYAFPSAVSGRIGLVDRVRVDGIPGETLSTFDSKGNLRETNAYGVVESYEYHPSGDLWIFTDANQHRYQFESYRRGVAQLVAVPTGLLEREVDDYGRVTRFTNERRITSTTSYDLADRLLTSSGPIGPGLRVTYSPDHRTKTVDMMVDGVSRRTDVGRYDGLGRLLQVEINGRYKQVNKYDISGRLIFSSDRLPLAQSIPDVTECEAPYPTIAGICTTHDVLDRAISVVRTGTGGSYEGISHVEFLGEGRVQSTDPMGNESMATFASFGGPGNDRLMRTDIPVTRLNQDGSSTNETMSTSFVRDVLGFAFSATQSGGGKSLTRRYSLNGKRQLDAEHSPEIAGATFTQQEASGPVAYNVSYCRDNRGNIIGKSLNQECTVDPQSGVILANLLTNVFDARGRLKEIRYVGESAPAKTYDYNEVGSVEKITRINGTDTVIVDPHYNELEQPVRQDFVIDAEGSSKDYRFRIGMEYDDLQQLRAIRYPSGHRVVLDPDVLGRPTKVQPFVTAISYYPSGMPDTVDFANGQKTKFTQTPAGRVDTIKTSFGGGGADAAVDLDYGYDFNGNPVTVADFAFSANLGEQPGRYSMEASYDQLNRLVKQNYVNVAGGGQMIRTYDVLGNVLADRTPDGLQLNFSYDTVSNRLAGVTSDQPSVFPNRGYTYDRLGNTTSDGQRSFEFNAASEMTRGSKDGKSKLFLHDGYERIIRESDGNETRYLIHLGEQLVLDFNETTGKYTEYAYLGSQLVGSRVVRNAAQKDSDGDGRSDLEEFRNPD